MLEYILEQEEISKEIILQNTKKSLFESFDRVIITASGSSLNAGDLAIEILGLKKDRFIVMDPFNLRYQTDYLDDKNNLVIGLSQTGRSTSTIACLKKANKSGLTTVSLTSGIENPLSEIAKIKVDILCGPEPIGPKTKGFLATTLMLIKFLSDNVLGYSFDFEKVLETVDKIPKIVTNTINWCERNKDWAEVETMSILGFGMDNALSREGSLKILETLQIPLMTYPAEEFMHGPHRTIKEGRKLIVINSEKNEYNIMDKFVDFSRKQNADILYLCEWETESGIEFIGSCNWLEILVILQTMSAILPTYIGIDPSEPVSQDFAKKVGTKI